MNIKILILITLSGCIVIFFVQIWEKLIFDTDTSYLHVLKNRRDKFNQLIQIEYNI